MAGIDFSQTQVQQQTETLQQRYSAQQLMVARLLELTTPELEDRVRMEITDNPALEETTDAAGEEEDVLNDAASEEEPSEPQELDSAPSAEDAADYDDYGDSDDYMPSGERTYREEIPIDAGRSFYDELQEQLRESPLNDEQQKIGLYIIGSLDDDGLLRKNLESICDELAFNQGVYVSLEEVRAILHQIQQFDPAGIGAQTTQECLLLQLNRKEPPVPPSLKRRILEECFDDFINNRWERIAPALSASPQDVSDACRELSRLNPRPGSSLEETTGKGMQQIIPDFFLDTEGELWLNDEHVPAIRVNREYYTMLQEQKKGGSSAQRDAAAFLIRKIDSARDFIQAVRQRNKTMIEVTSAIVSMQHDYCREGYDSLLRPMTLKDVAQRTGYDVSTVSRVTNNKYIQTPFGLIPIKHFFSNKQVRIGGNDSDKTIQSGAALQALQALVDKEDKARPLNDSELEQQMKALGFNVARRTIAKYRTQLNIPTAPLRKK